MNLCVFATYDRLNRSTNRHETMKTYRGPSRDGHCNIYFLEDRNNVRRVTAS